MLNAELHGSDSLLVQGKLLFSFYAIERQMDANSQIIGSD
jgi:hypothetical protein